MNENLYWEALRYEMGKVTFRGNTASEITQELEACALRVMKTVCKIVAEHAPVAKGTLADSFEVVPPGSALLDGKETYILDIG
jgi:hypothetical protein